MARWLYTLPLRVRSLLRKDRVEDELSDELQFHVDQLTQQHIAAGMSAEAARHAALRSMGGVEQRKEECRDARRVRAIENAFQDLRYALRLMRHSPGFTVVALASLSLGIGANAAMFQLLDAIGLRTLPIERPYELAEVRIAGGNRGFGQNDNSNSQMTNPLWEQLRGQQQAFAGIFAWGDTQMLVGRGADMRPVRLLWTSGELFPVLGVRPALGRLFTAADDRRGCGAQSVVISDDFWRNHFGASPSAIGARLPILDQSAEVIGVTPTGFVGLDVGRRFDIALPLCTAAMWGSSLDRRNVFWLTVMGRLKPDWTVARAAAHVDALSAGLLEATIPPGYDATGTATYRRFRLTALSAARGVSGWRASYEQALWWLLGMTGMVLLIGCANISNLMLARANARGREIAVRVALGATRGRLVSQTLVEGLVLAAAGGAIGMALAGVMSRALVAMLTTDRSRLELELAFDWRLLAFTAFVAVVACAAFAIVPAWRSSQADPLPAMQSGARGATPHRRARLQRLLVAGQVALSLVLLVGALLFVRSFRNLTTVETGLRQEGVVFVNLFTLVTPRPGADQIIAFEQALLRQLRSIPGVHAAAAASNFPLNGASWTQGVIVPTHDGEQKLSSKFTYVSPQYFSTFEIPMLAGRDFEDTDTARSRKVAIVNETFVRRYVPDGQPLGKTVRTTPEPNYPEAIYEVVGVVKDTKYSNLREETPPIAYVPVTQHPFLRPYPGVVVRSDLPPSELIAQIRLRINELHPDVVMGFTVFTTQMRERLVRERTLAWLAGGFGVLATLMSTIGLYGVISYLAARRRQEIAIRRALGASRSTIVSLMLSEMAVTLGIGIPIGVAVSTAVVRGAGGLLFGLSPHDPQTLAASAALLAAVGVVASAIPAIRATRISPTEALRSD
jgi:predicted permease